jgi:prepilin-type processing-associated H-X9-DG protein
MLLPVLGKSKEKARAIKCLSNLRQLQMAWYIYSSDFSDRIVVTGGSAWLGNPNNWVLGTVSDPPPVNLNDIQNGLLFPYAKVTGIYKCPADMKMVIGAGSTSPTLRSMSMNAWMNPGALETALGNTAKFVLFRKQSDIRKPVDTWVTIDENPGTINDGWFVVNPESGSWVDIPAAYHNFSGALSFADGHAESRKWTDPAARYGGGIGSPSTPPPPAFSDLKWLQLRTTVLVN